MMNNLTRRRTSISGTIARMFCAAVSGAIVLASLAAAGSLALAADDTGLSLFSTNDQDQRISYLALIKLLNADLAGAQQVNIYDGVCHGGGLLTAAGNLSMPFFIGVGEKDPAVCTTSDSSKADQKPPGRLTISPAGDDKNFYYGFDEYITKRLQNVATIPTAQSLFTAAQADVLADPGLKGQTPGSTQSKDANINLAINGGTNSNHALIFDGTTGGLNSEALLETYRALAQGGYGFTNKGNSLQFYKSSNAKQSFEGTNIDGPGTLANLKAALTNIQASVKANPNKELVNIFFQGHGYLKAVAAPRQNGMNGVPKDGAVVSGGGTSTLTLPTDAAFWEDLEVGIEPNDESLTRIFPPQFSLSVSEDGLSAPIGITIDGLSLGSFSLPSSSTGAELDVPMPDSLTAALLLEAEGDTSIPISFTLGPGDFFRIATEDDILLDPNYQQDQYGFGISTVVAGIVPEPASLLLLLNGVVLLAVSRRSRRTCRQPVTSGAIGSRLPD
jgi:hypothetical protein